MIVHSDGHCFLRILLPHHIFIQLCLDLVRRRNILDIQFMEFFRFFLFLLNLLRFRLHILQIRHIEELYARHIHQTVQIHRAVGHGVKASLHTVRTHCNIIGKINHLPRHALRTVTDKTDLLISVVIFLIRTAVFFIGGNNFLFLLLSGRAALSVILFFFIFLIYYDEILIRHINSLLQSINLRQPAAFFL